MSPLRGLFIPMIGPYINVTPPGFVNQQGFQLVSKFYYSIHFIFNTNSWLSNIKFLIHFDSFCLTLPNSEKGNLVEIHMYFGGAKPRRGNINIESYFLSIITANPKGVALGKQGA